MLDSSGILNKDLIKLANKAEKLFKQQMDIARIAVDKLPESEAKLKVKLNGLLKSTTNKNANTEDLINQLNKIIPAETNNINATN